MVMAPSAQSASNLQNRQEWDNPKSAQLVTLRAPGRKGATGAWWAAGRLQEKSGGVLADGTFDG